MNVLKELTINGRKYTIHYFTGAVVDEKKWSETEVSGSGGGGGGYTVGGTGMSAPSYVDVRSKTSRFEQFMLKNKDQEKSFSFQDWGIACRNGNVLSVLWAIADGQDKGPFILVYNHDSREFFMDDELAKIFVPGRFTLRVVGTNMSWWPWAGIPGAPAAWAVLWTILPIDIGGLYGLSLFAMPFVGFFGARKFARRKGQAAADAYLSADPDGLVQAVKETRADAVAAAA